MNPFVRKLRHGTHLTDDDERALTRLCAPVRQFDRYFDISQEGSEPRSIVLVLSGWACRYKQLENGKRQIVNLFVPGDLSEPFGTLPRALDYSLGSLTPIELVFIPVDVLRSAWQASPQIEGALWWDLLKDDAIARERVVGLGRRTATERLGHLICELHMRLGLVGLAEGASFEMPLTQTDLADLLGLSTVHVNRSLQELRSLGLLTLHARRLTIHNLQELGEMSMFDPTYLSPNVTPRS